VQNVNDLIELPHDCCACHSFMRFCNAAKRSALAASGPTTFPSSDLPTLRVVEPVADTEAACRIRVKHTTHPAGGTGWLPGDGAADACAAASAPANARCKNGTSATRAGAPSTSTS